MTNKEAFGRALQEFGNDAVVGTNVQYPDMPLYVGKRTHRSEWLKFGAGSTWEEAFANVKNVVRQRGNGRFVFEGDEDAS